MRYSIPGPAAILDTDNDGFVDQAYIGDMGGNMWRFQFCLKSDESCGVLEGDKKWSGRIFFDSASGNIRPIYTSPAAAKDSSGNLWVYWGTGDKTDPTAPNAQEHFYGVKDNGGFCCSTCPDSASSCQTSNIDNITQATQTYIPTAAKVGWRIQLAGGGQKVLADPTVFGGVVYYTTYAPPSGNDPCEQGGVATLHGVNYTTGAGAISQTVSGVTTAVRSIDIGYGIASAPVISMKPSGDSNVPDLYVTTSGGGGSSSSTMRVDIVPPGVTNRTNMLFWRDRRIR